MALIRESFSFKDGELFPERLILIFNLGSWNLMGLPSCKSSVPLLSGDLSSALSLPAFLGVFYCLFNNRIEGTLSFWFCEFSYWTKGRSPKTDALLYSMVFLKYAASLLAIDEVPLLSKLIVCRCSMAFFFYCAFYVFLLVLSSLEFPPSCFIFMNEGYLPKKNFLYDAILSGRVSSFS